MSASRRAPTYRRESVLTLFALAILGGFSILVPSRILAAGFAVRPPEVQLGGDFARAQLIVTATDDAGQSGDKSADLTSTATFESSNPQIASVTPAGRILAVADGQATITIQAEGTSKQVSVTVTGTSAVPKVSFLGQVAPVLGKAGCNAGACHASQHGKGGFKLSVFGFAPEEDYEAIVRDRQGRRINSLEPERSLFLLKPTMTVPHGGQRRLNVDDVDYRILREWLAAAANQGIPSRPNLEEPKCVSIEVEPRRRVGAPGFVQQLRVVATYSDGAARDVTHWTKFDSLDDSVATVTPAGLARANGRGQAPIMARFEGQVAVAGFIVPYAESVPLAGWTDVNFIDTLAAAKFRELGIEPSGLCDDASFLRRASFDSVGALPTAEEAKAFLDSTEPDKRAKLVDRLLGLTGDPTQDKFGRNYSAFWSLKWADLIRSTGPTLGEQGMWAMHNWLQASFRENKPFDRFTRELILGKGSAFSNGPANYYRVASSPQDLAETTAQLFLGVRLQCAKCHHHPFEKYGQDDYYGFAAFFARVGAKGSQEFGIFGGETVVVTRSAGEVGHPRSGKIMRPTPLDGAPVADTRDRRAPLADWIVAPGNPFFARNIANRYFSYLMGRGLVEPVDDMRGTNPASNPELLDALAADFAKGGFDVKKLLRTIMTSRLYQLDSRPTPANVADQRFYSHFPVKRIAAEPLLDAIDQATEVPTKFKNMPLGTRAVELPDAEYPDYFLKTFGKPRRASVCECERPSMANLAQALQTLNGELLAKKIADPNGRVARLAASGASFDALLDELFLATWSRRPTPEERAELGKFSAENPDLKSCLEDVTWSLVNSKQFQYVH